MTQNRIELTVVQEVPILTVHTYFDAEIGQGVTAHVEDILQRGGTRLIIDLTTCAIVNSSGVAALLDLACKVVQDFRGCLFLAGLDTLKRTVLDIGGVLMFAQEVKTPQDALVEIAKDA